MRKPRPLLIQLCILDKIMGVYQIICFPKLYFLIAAIAIIGCRHPNEKILNRYPNGNILEEFIASDNDTTSGILKIFYMNGKIYIEATLHNGKYVGVKKTFYENGKIKQIDSLNEPCDTLVEAYNGMVIRYNENGTLSQRYTVKNNAHNGPTWQYTNDGILAKQYELLNDSIKNGYYIEYYPNGTPGCKLNFKNNILTGMAYFFLSTGDTTKYYNNNEGYGDFPYKVWFDKKRSILGIYTDTSMKSVTWIWYEGNKELKRKVEKLPTDEIKSPTW